MAFNQYAYAGELRDPRTAAILSVVPGLGQFYNGEARKGLLFLDVAIINYMLLSLTLLAPGIARAAQEFGGHFGMKVNQGVLEALRQMHFGSPVSLIVSGLILAFIGYAVRDAYDHAQSRRRRALYRDCVLDLTEATSGSYIIHASVIMTLAIMAIFFFIPRPAARQITEIEFFDSVITQVRPIHKPLTPDKAVSTQNTVERIKQFDKNKPIQKVPPKAELSKTQPQNNHNQAQSRPVPPAAAASPSAPPAAAQPPRPVTLPAFKPVPTRSFQPAAPASLPAKLAQAIAPSAIRPVAPVMPGQHTNAAAPLMAKAPAPAGITNLAPRAISLPNAGTAMPSPLASTPGSLAATPQQALGQLLSGSLPSRSNVQAMPASGGPSGGLKNAVQLPGTGSMPQGLGTGPAFAPRTGSTGGSTNGSFTGSQGPVLIATHVPGTGGDAAGPVPQKIGGNGKHGTRSGPDGPGSENGPAPVKAGGHGIGYSEGPIRIVPQTGGPSGPAGPGTQSGSGNDPLNFQAAHGPNTAAGVADADFTKYMIDLQRKIKRAWSPPREGQTKKVKVIFKIHTQGDMSNLRLVQTSGSTLSDKAALAAIEAASPFGHLPEHAPENVDIEFTFDYNVFNSRSF
jgi:TonB family protein